MNSGANVAREGLALSGWLFAQRFTKGGDRARSEILQAQQVTLRTFDHTGGSDKPVHRNFCPDCGSPITSITGARPGLSSIKAGTLDDASWLKPTVEIWCGSAQPWVSLAGDRQKFAKTPS